MSDNFKKFKSILDDWRGIMDLQASQVRSEANELPIEDPRRELELDAVALIYEASSHLKKVEECFAKVKAIDEKINEIKKENK